VRGASQLGDYWVETRFGCITQCNSPDFNGDDGIVGNGRCAKLRTASPWPEFAAVPGAQQCNHQGTQRQPKGMLQAMRYGKGSTL
jgi:hypothetical protein